ncbi:MAG: PH domain-containing protein [Actinomycetota bacterium]
MIFKPRPSIGKISVFVVTSGFVCGSLLLTLLFWIYGFTTRDELIPGLIILTPINAFVIIYGIYLLRVYPTIHYKVENGNLSINCGRYHWIIPIKTISSIVEKDLKYSPLAGTKLPGFALGDNYYSDVGIVRMCSTALVKRILLIYTDQRIYGITPDKVGEFISALRKEGLT